PSGDLDAADLDQAGIAGHRGLGDAADNAGAGQGDPGVCEVGHHSPYKTRTVRDCSPGEYGSDRDSMAQRAAVRPAPVTETMSPVTRPGCGTIVTCSLRYAWRRRSFSCAAAAVRHWATVVSSDDW